MGSFPKKSTGSVPLKNHSSFVICFCCDCAKGRLIRWRVYLVTNATGVYNFWHLCVSTGPRTRFGLQGWEVEWQWIHYCCWRRCNVLACLILATFGRYIHDTSVKSQIENLVLGVQAVLSCSQPQQCAVVFSKQDGWRKRPSFLLSVRLSLLLSMFLFL